MPDDLISVTVPVYKVERYLERCVKSLRNQSYQNLELVLVDDGSPDTCGMMLDEYLPQDSRIVVIHQKNGGLSAARNSGIELAQRASDCKWLSFVDSDDWVHKDYLRSLLKVCLTDQAKVSVCGYYQVEDEEVSTNDGSLQSVVVTPEELWCQFRGRISGNSDCFLSPTVAWGKLYAKELFQSIRYPVGKLHEDEFCTYKILFSLERVAVLKAGLLYYYQNPCSIVGSKWNPKRLDVIEALQSQARYFKEKEYMDAYRFARRSLYDNLLAGIDHLKNDGDWIKGERFRFLFKTVLLGDAKYNHPFSDYEVYYLFAYPVGFRLFLYMRSAVYKLRRIAGRIHKECD